MGGVCLQATKGVGVGGVCLQATQGGRGWEGFVCKLPRGVVGGRGYHTFILVKVYSQ